MDLLVWSGPTLMDGRSPTASGLHSVGIHPILIGGPVGFRVPSLRGLHPDEWTLSHRFRDGLITFPRRSAGVCVRRLLRSVRKRFDAASAAKLSRAQTEGQYRRMAEDLSVEVAGNLSAEMKKAVTLVML